MLKTWWSHGPLGAPGYAYALSSPELLSSMLTEKRNNKFNHEFNGVAQCASTEFCSLARG